MTRSPGGLNLLRIRGLPGPRVWALAVALIPAACLSGPTPEVGELDPIHARPAEDIRTVELGRGQTLGGLLSGAVDADDYYPVLMAFREQASPRRMRPDTEITFRYLPGEVRVRGIDVEVNEDE
ncbi:MAG: hypothetical protein OEZ37_07435, partial [Gemmatimonadota bacterium]|nr:hypothetical protein [Gemmatimonadota bacterium]